MFIQYHKTQWIIIPKLGSHWFSKFEKLPLCAFAWSFNSLTSAQRYIFFYLAFQCIFPFYSMHMKKPLFAPGKATKWTQRDSVISIEPVNSISARDWCWQSPDGWQANTFIYNMIHCSQMWHSDLQATTARSEVFYAWEIVAFAAYFLTLWWIRYM